MNQLIKHPPSSDVGKRRSVPDIWKKAVFLFAGMLFGCMAYSQSYLPYDLGWLMIGESEGYVDVSARVVSCDGEAQVHFQFFNENPTDQEQGVTIELSSEGQKTLTLTYKVPLTPGEMIQPECGADGPAQKYAVLLPRGYNPEKISAGITFKSQSDTK